MKRAVYSWLRVYGGSHEHVYAFLENTKYEKYSYIILPQYTSEYIYAYYTTLLQKDRTVCNGLILNTHICNYILYIM